MTDGYKKTLAFELRWRGLRDQEIADIVDELPCESDDALTEEFGEPEVYAASFPRGSRRSAGWWILTVSVVVAVGVVLARLVGVMTRMFEQSIIVSIVFLGGGIALVAVAAIVAAAVDRRPPK